MFGFFRSRVTAWPALIAIAALVGCGGGGTVLTPPATNTFTFSSGGYGGVVTFPGTAPLGSLTITGGPAPCKTIATPPNGVFCVYATASKTLAFSGFPKIVVTAPSALPASGVSVTFFDPTVSTTAPESGIVGSVTVSGNTLTESGTTTPFTFVAGVQYVIVLSGAGLPTPAPSPTPTATPTATATATASGVPTASPTASGAGTPTPTASATSGPTASPTATATGTAKPTATPTSGPTATPTATAKPTATPTSAPTATPTSAPTATPTATAKPTATPTSAPTATPTPTPTPSPTPTNAPLVLTASPNPVNVVGTGAPNAQPLVVSEQQYTQTITESDTCSGIATVSPGSGLGPQVNETVTGVAAGSCTANFSDAFNQKTAVSIVVTTGGIIIESHPRSR